jgi:peptidoglycan/xylan/chitin deacetylase (PgdA/CDA1 family)
MNGLLNAFTVDLEDWFQGLTSTNPLVDRWPRFESRVVPATRTLLEILRRHRVRATFFVLGYVADRARTRRAWLLAPFCLAHDARRV